MTALCDANDLLAPAVAETITALGKLTAEDAGAIRLAERYAEAIDASRGNPRNYASALRWLGPLLLDALQQLGATPAARVALAKGVKAPDATESQLDKLRAARRRA